MLRESTVFKSLFLVGLFLASLFAAGWFTSPPVLMVEKLIRVAVLATCTFVDGSFSYYIYHPALSSNIQVAMPIGAEVTEPVTISGASATDGAVLRTPQERTGGGRLDYVDTLGICNAR